MQIQLINNQFDSELKTIELTEKTYNNILESVKKPIVVVDKSKIPQWKFCTIKGNKRCTENMDKTNMLILDFDDSTYTFKEFEHQYQEYKYILHTSYSYNGTNSKFRVLLPLDEEYEIDRMFAKLENDRTYSPYHYLINYFHNVDPASFVKAQFFKVPAVNDEKAPYYYNIHEGKVFSLFDIPGYQMAYLFFEEHRKKDERERKLKYDVQRTQFNGDLTRAVEYVKRKMEEAPTGMRHNCIFGLACWFSKVGGDYKTFTTIKPSWADKSFNNQIKRLEKEWDKIGIK